MSNIDKIKNDLMSFAPRFLGEDRVEAAVKLNCNPETINRYMRGEVKKENFGFKLLAYVKNKVQENEKVFHS